MKGTNCQVDVTGSPLGKEEAYPWHGIRPPEPALCAPSAGTWGPDTHVLGSVHLLPVHVTFVHSSP